ncbi:hypothetical protein N665_1277s0002 [Sinapis alba]|nr:hypothetical protein N665_1277s0002 [Sinapis alba]
MEQCMLTHGYATYNLMPYAEQENWFWQFAQEYTVNPGLTHAVKDAFNHYASDHYRGQVNEWKQLWEAGKVPKHINPTAWEIATNDNNPIDDFILLKSAYTNKYTGEFKNPVMKEVIHLVQSKADDIILTHASEDGSCAFSNSLTWEQLNNLVLELMEHIKNKDDEIQFLKTDNVDIRSQLHQNKSELQENWILTESLLERLKNRFGPNF